MKDVIGIRFRKNGKIYYFAIATYSKYDDRIVGTLSKEVYARPLRK